MNRTESWARWLGAGLGIVGGFALGYAMVRAGEIHPPGSTAIVALTTMEGLIFTYLGTPYLFGGWRRVNLSLTTTPLPDLLTGLLGMILGLVLAVLVGSFVHDFPFGVLLSGILAALLAFTGARLGMTRRAELVALFGGRGALTPRAGGRIPAVLLDTSVIIDGRVLDLIRTGFVDIPVVVLRSVLKELQLVADSSDAMKRARGRRGLDILTLLEKEPGARMEVLDDDSTGPLEIDARLVRTAKARGWAIMTNDFNLNQVAGLEGIRVLNLNQLSNAMRPVAIPGEEVSVQVVKDGKEPGQGIGYLDDGTMVVVEGGRRLRGQTVTVTVSSVLQTAAGRMIFASPPEGAASARRPRGTTP